SSALIPGVTVKAFNLQTGATATTVTDETGKYELKNLPEGQYKVTAELPGFKTGVIDALKKEDNAGLQGKQGQQSQQASTDFKLQVGAVSQAVEVTVAADALLSTSSSAQSLATAQPDAEVARGAGGRGGAAGGAAPRAGVLGSLGGALR